MNNQKMKAR